ncbi:MAG TPA: (d)CMP kinase [Desulfuromonadales bacterium]|nr:(d)CMP kinase [Desulfuromonadales bacterium]
MSARKNGIIIALDGPSGAGKSTVARLLADGLGYMQIDTGAMYRAAALLISQAGIDVTDQLALVAFCNELDIRLELHNGRQRVVANGADVTELIRTPEMSLLTSRTSALKPVRDALLKLQRLLGSQGGVVLEGRDIGTVVFPDAELKFYLIASAEERGRRRYQELTLKGEQVSLEGTIAEVIARDQQDSERDLAPLRQAEDAIAIDSSHLTLEEVLTRMMAIFHQRTESTGSTL